MTEQEWLIRYKAGGFRTMTTLKLILAASLALAPAPSPRPPRPPPPSPITGDYTLTWGGTVCAAVLHTDGSYACLYQGSPWAGTWRYDAASETLTVIEWPAANALATMEWGVKMGRKWSGEGKWSGSVGVRMERRGP